MMKPRHIKFTEMAQDAYTVRNERTNKLLGAIVYYEPWRQFVLESQRYTMWSEECLKDVREFIIKLNKGMN